MAFERLGNRRRLSLSPWHTCRCLEASAAARTVLWLFSRPESIVCDVCNLHSAFHKTLSFPEDALLHIKLWKSLRQRVYSKQGKQTRGVSVA